MKIRGCRQKPGYAHCSEGKETITKKKMLYRTENDRPAILLPPIHQIPIRAGNVVEITGPSPSAKSEILLQAAVQCILPKEWNGVHFGGMERAVAYIDLDCRFDVLRIAQLLKSRISSAYGSVHGTCWNLFESFPRSSLMVQQADKLGDELFLSCLKRFLYIRCYNSSEFLAALKTMHSSSLRSSKELDASLHILIIDSIGAFHWNDRAWQPLTKDGSTWEKLSLEKITESIVKEINKIREVQPLLVLVSKATIFGVANPTNDTHRFYKEGSEGLIKQDKKKLLFCEYMSPIWQLLVTHRVFLGISDVNSSDGRDEEFPTFVCEWIHPTLNILSKFVVRNDGIHMVS